MSIQFSLKLSGYEINELTIKNEINKLASGGEFSLIDENIIEFDTTYDLLGFTVTLIKNKKPPYNIYEMTLLERDFEYNQVILFDFNKESDLRFAYSKALQIIFNLMKRIHTHALLTSSVHDEICYFENSTKVYINGTVELLEQIKNITKADEIWEAIILNSISAGE
ncbi:hypothetical protein [Paenibacillus oralis]|nr:hypothetical protein [Paenibacillus oralis]